jgi:hypothetical protein
MWLHVGASRAEVNDMKDAQRLTPFSFVVITTALFWASSATAVEALFDSSSVLELSIHAPFSRLDRSSEGHGSVEGRIELQDGVSIPVTLSRYGLSRLQMCTTPPLKVDIGDEDSRGTPFEGIRSVRLVPPCLTEASFDRYILLEYLVYRSWAIIGEPAVGVRLVSCRFQDSEKPAHYSIGLSFLMEDIGEAAARHGRTWLDIETQSVPDLKPEQCAVFALFQFMVGNTDWSAVASAAGERCCHNVAVFGAEDDPHNLLLPFDFDQSGLVNAPYAAPNRQLPIRFVTQRIYRGFCLHNAEVPAAVAVFNAKRPELEDLFNDEGLPDKKARKRAWKYIESFYDTINNPRKLEKKILCACR